ncbi:MAG: membrane integrity-associated transporter subunit PqiC [Deltaproteobacteria bacterium]|nr:membrane integrity-associated transporter subunit PqiC [Deltaproteobacteria bacterium]MBW1845905.1 membrane integrity-associated transporter subunit PqiC [Deltaproteobacteria bacterium]MBW2363541.1 membrane integrity-associated transporter subunit PqiC [Deltaproteobacteria bacterium]
MRRNIILPVLVVLAACFISGCFGFSNPNKMISYYTLEYNAPKIEGLTTLPFAILIERFQVTPMYDSNKIIYKNSEFKRESYSYHRWRANPGDIVTHLLARDFKETSLFKAIFTLDSRYPATHMLKGTIEEFYEKDGEDYWESVLSLSVALIKKDEIDPLKSIIFQKKYNMKEVCSKKNPQAFAEAMSKAMEKLSNVIMKDVYNSLLK